MRLALWMGVPAISLAGSLPWARVGLALMSQLGLESFVAGSEDQYVEIALKWARDLEGSPRCETLYVNGCGTHHSATRRPKRESWKRLIEHCGARGAAAPFGA